MIKTTPEKLSKSEPLQWGLDYIEESLDFIMDSEIEQDYKMDIVISSGKNLIQQYQSLLKREAVSYKGTLITHSWAAGKIMTLRLLVKATPCPAQSYIHTADKIMFYYIYHLKFLRKFFSKINLINCRNMIPKEFILEVLEMAENNGLNLDCLKSRGYPLLICSLPYEEKQPGCYFHSFHTAVLFASSHEDSINRHLILHELSHALFNLSSKGRNNKGPFNNLLSLIKKYYPQSRVISVKDFKLRYLEEVFAELLATYLFSGAPTKNQLSEELSEELSVSGQQQSQSRDGSPTASAAHVQKPFPPELQNAVKLYLENLD